MSERRLPCRSKVLYHVTMAPAREIELHGIDYRRAGKSYEEDEGLFLDPPANYLWPTLRAAERWARCYCRGSASIYAVDVAGLSLRRDRFWDGLPAGSRHYRNFVGPRGGRPRAYYSEEPLAAGRLRLVGRAEAALPPRQRRGASSTPQAASR